MGKRRSGQTPLAASTIAGRCALRRSALTATPYRSPSTSTCHLTPRRNRFRRRPVQVRTRLTAGGKRIRTLSPTRDALGFETVFPLYDGSISRKGSVRALPGLRVRIRLSPGLRQQRTGAGRSHHEAQTEDPLHNQDQQPDDDDLHRLTRWYREQIKAAMPGLVAKWEPILGGKVERVFVQQMKTKWGSCNPTSRSIRVNSDLAKKPPECLEYIVVREMAHLLVRHHNDLFKNLMDRF